MLTDNAKASSKPQDACCFVCGEIMEHEQPGGCSILCGACSETADLPMSTYYLHQYYYRFAD